MPSIETLLSSKTYRRTLLLLLFSTAIVVFLARIFLVRDRDLSELCQAVGLTSSLLDTLLISLIAFAVTTLAIGFLDPRSKSLEVVIAPDVKHELAKLLDGATEYLFFGNSARHFTSVTLPALIKAATTGRQPVKISVEILDPSVELACTQYRDMRRGVGFTNGLLLESVQNDLAASIISIYAAAKETPRLYVERIVLRSTVSIFRADLSNRAVMLTTEGRDEPAIRFTSENHFFRKVHDHLLRQLDQGKQLLAPAKLGADARSICSSLDDVSAANVVKAILEEIGLTNLCSDPERLREIALAVKNRKNPYG